MTPTIGSAKVLTPVVTRSLTWPIHIPGFTCTHPHKRKAKNVTAAVGTEQGGKQFLRLPDGSHHLRRFASVSTCIKCDEVLEMEEASDGR